MASLPSAEFLWRMKKEREEAGPFPFGFAQGQDDKQKSKSKNSSNCNCKNKYGGLSTAAAKSAAFGRDDSIGVLRAKYRDPSPSASLRVRMKAVVIVAGRRDRYSQGRMVRSVGL